MFFASSDVNQTSVKVSLQRWDLPLTINILLNGREWEDYVEKRLLKVFFEQMMKSWWGKTLIKVSVWDL